MQTDTEWQSKVFPVRERAELEPADQPAMLVVVGRERDSGLDAFVQEQAQPLETGGLDRAWIPLLHAYAVRSGGPRLKKLGVDPRVQSIWLLPEHYEVAYVNILRGIAYATQNLPPGSASNVSLGLPASVGRREFDENEPIQLLTREAAARGITFVFSAGNDGPNENTLNPWGLADWTISVGAATADGSKIWKHSSRGRPGDPRYRPTIVAPGIDRITTHPRHVPKTADQLAAEDRLGLADQIPAERLALYTVVTGTSAAAAEISRCVAQLLFFLRAEVKQLAARSEPFELKLQFPAEKPLADDRLAGSLERRSTDQVVTYALDRPDPMLIKQLLKDIAQPVPDTDPHESGAGFVSYEMVVSVFGKHGEAEPQIMPIKTVDQ